MKQVVKVSTKANKDAPEKVTALTVDWEGATLDQIKAYALQALVVKLQGRWRKNGIPASDTFVVKDNPVGSKAQPESLEQQLARMSETERHALFAKYGMAQPTHTEGKEEAE